MPFTFTDGTAVDPDSLLEAVSHVYVDGGTKYFAILNLTDIQEDKNSYFKIQLLELDDKRRYFSLFPFYHRTVSQFSML